MHCSDLWLITNLCPLCRPFSVTQIPHTNLVLIVADKMCPCFATKISIEPTKVEYGPTNETAYCDRLKVECHY